VQAVGLFASVKIPLFFKEIHLIAKPVIFSAPCLDIAGHHSEYSVKKQTINQKLHSIRTDY
jgi:hypothetical protein